MRNFKRLAGVAAIGIGLGLSLAGAWQTADAQGTRTIKITAPADGAGATNPVSVSVESSGATIKAATAGDSSASHYHYFVDQDPASVVRPGAAIPTGQPQIIHSAEGTQRIPDLAPGQHSVWVVLTNNDHIPYDPNVQAKVSFTVGSGSGGAPSTLPRTGDGTAGLLFLGGLGFALGGLGLVRAGGRRR